MQEIPLTQGRVALVDDADHELLSLYRWCCLNGRYAMRSETRDGKRYYPLMHREILGAPEHLNVDHINHNTLDNRRENLRICTQSQNLGNRRKTQGKIYKGVYEAKRKTPLSKPFIAQIMVNGRARHLGYHKTPEEAALSYNEAAKLYFGEFALLNEVNNA